MDAAALPDAVLQLPHSGAQAPDLGVPGASGRDRLITLLDGQLPFSQRFAQLLCVALVLVGGARQRDLGLLQPGEMERERGGGGGEGKDGGRAARPRRR